MSGPQCCENPPTSGSSAGENGRIEEIGGLKSYTSGSLASKLAVVLIADIHGTFFADLSFSVFRYEAPKLRLIADKVAAIGFYVVVPDFFYGDPYVPETPLSSWFRNHLPAKGDEDARKVVNFVKIYPGVTHGWTVRYKDDDEHVVKYAMEAHSD
ncbi:endo-1,3;1,4-beta-D-glucanase-like protein isoform X2, partial [Tanacetum coccineum]